MTAIILSTISALLIAASPPGPSGLVPRATTEWDQREEGLWKIGVVGQQAMSVTGVEALYSGLLGHSNAQPRVVQLSAFNDASDAIRYQINPRPEASYSDAIAALRAARSP